MIFDPRNTYNIAGVWQVTVNNGKTYDLKIPGTLDESNIGNRDTLRYERVPVVDDSADTFDVFLSEEEDGTETEPAPILSRYTRKYRYEDPARIRRTLTFRETEGKRLFLDVERARTLRLYIDGQPVPHFTAPVWSAPQTFEVTGLLNGTHTIELESDNSGRGLPKKTLLRSNMASNDSQTDWNGLLGFVQLREEPARFPDTVLVRPGKDSMSLYLEIASEEAGTAELTVRSDVLAEEVTRTLEIEDRYSGYLIEGLPLREDASRWGEGKGELHDLTVVLDGDEKTVRFGLRVVSADENGMLTLDGAPLRLLGDTNMAVFPETAYAPMNESAWEAQFRKYLDFGVNFVRFRSWCPPDAAFSAADRMGLLLMAELSLEGGSKETAREIPAYYRREMARILRAYGNHPSLVMIGCGAAFPVTDQNVSGLRKILEMAKALDPSRLYAPGAGLILSDAGLEPPGDVLITNDELQKTLFASLKKPVLAMELGGYELLPDLREIDLFSGLLEPDNLTALRENVFSAGIYPNWASFFEASGEGALQMTRTDVEKALADPKHSGVILQGLQDFPGRGTGLFGMMNSHMMVKDADFARPVRFREFFRKTGPLLSIGRLSYNYGDKLTGEFLFMNNGTEDLRAEASYELAGDGMRMTGEFPEQDFPAGAVTDVGFIYKMLDLQPGPEGDPPEKKPQVLTLTLRVGKWESRYRIFVYPYQIPVCPPDIHTTKTLDRETLRRLSEGEKVFLSPPADEESLPLSVPAERTKPDGNEEECFGRGTRGLFIQSGHPVFREFPAERYGDGRFDDLLPARAAVLQRNLRPIVSVLDNCRQLRNLGLLFECRVLNGTVFFSGFGLLEKDGPAAAALLAGIYRYMDSYEFSPAESLRPEELRKLLKDEPQTEGTAEWLITTPAGKN